MAVDEFRLHLLDFPEDVNAHVNLSLALSELKRFDEAAEHAGTAIGLMPDESVGHFAMAVALEGKKDKRALDAINEALRLDPSDPDVYALRGQMSFRRKKWQQALAEADAGLALDPEHHACINIRAQALVMLNERQAAADTLGQALARRPDDSVTHANAGWAALERGQPKPAMEHFREALRLDADNDWARHGIVEAMKAGNILYRVFLKWLFLIMKLPTNVAIGLVVVGLFAVNALSQVGESWPAAAPFITALIVLYLAFAVLTWVADLAFNLVLQLNRYGRLALSDQQRKTSLMFGAWMCGALVAAGLSLLSDNPVVREFGITKSILSVIVAAAILKTWGQERSQLVAAAGVIWVATVIFVATQMRLVDGKPMITTIGDSARQWITPLFLAVQFLPLSTRPK